MEHLESSVGGVGSLKTTIGSALNVCMSSPSGFGVASKSSVVLPVVDTWHCIIHRIEAIAAATNNELPIAITSIIQIVSCFEPPSKRISN